MERTATIKRKTKETEITLDLNLDGTGICKSETGIGFLDHMIQSFAKHSFFNINLIAKGDLIVDGHHTTEDVGIVLGQAIRTALGDKKGIKRYGQSLLPMDETLVLCAVDLSGRPFLNFDASFTQEKIGYLETETIHEFFYAVSYSAGMNLHLKQLDGGNNHHIAEAMFKGFARAMAEAVSIDSRITGVLSAKGVI